MSTPEKPLVTLTTGELRSLLAEVIEKALASVNDEWVDIERAAKILSVSTHWLYHQRKKLPFARKIGPKQLRFSIKGIQKWMESRGR